MQVILRDIIIIIYNISQIVDYIDRRIRQIVLYVPVTIALTSHFIDNTRTVPCRILRFFRFCTKFHRNLQPAVDRQPDHRRGDSQSMILIQNYFKTTLHHSRSILKVFPIYFKHFIFFHFYHFLAPSTSTSVRVKPYLKVYR